MGKKIDSAEIDHLARALLNICNYKCTTCYLIFHLLADEFSTNQENTILRGNSLTTKLETTFCRKEFFFKLIHILTHSREFIIFF